VTVTLDNKAYKNCANILATL